MLHVVLCVVLFMFVRLSVVCECYYCLLYVVRWLQLGVVICCVLFADCGFGCLCFD